MRQGGPESERFRGLVHPAQRPRGVGSRNSAAPRAPHFRQQGAPRPVGYSSSRLRFLTSVSLNAPYLLRNIPSVAPMMWMLLDCSGRILQTGEEVVSQIHFRRTLEARFPGICTSELIIVPWCGRDGEPMRDSRGRVVTVACGLLAAGSSLPGECSEARHSRIINSKIQGVQRC